MFQEYGTLLLLTVFLTLSLNSAPKAAIAEPLQMGLQGRLTSIAGGAAADGPYALAVSFYEQQAGGAAVWQEKFLAVAVQGGVFAVTLGTEVIKLDSALFSTGKALWVGVQVGGDPELARQPLLRVPHAVQALQANNAADLQCSGCVGSDDLAKAAVTGEKIAQGAVGANHVSFSWAAGESAGGPATFALAANTAKLADQAKTAEQATFADEAGAANQAKVAADLQCTGCVQLADIDPAVLAPYAKTADLGAVAKLGGDNTFLGANEFLGKSSFKGLATSAGIDFAKTEAKWMRFHNAATEPAPCDANAVGLVYYNTSENALYVCNGSSFALFASAVALGTDGNPAGSCKAIKDSTPAVADGSYWLDPDGKSGPAPKFLAWCDMTTDGGGWTELLRCEPGDSCAVGGTFLYTVDWTTSDKGTLGTTGSYLHGLSVKPVLLAAKEFLVSVTDTAVKQTGQMKFALDANTQQFFAGSGRYESAPLQWTLWDGDGSKSTQTSRICWQPAGSSYNIRSFQGTGGLKFLGLSSVAPSATANSDCDYGAWTSQMLIRSGTGNVSANFGAGPSAHWGAQNYTHRILVR